ncbi:unnamed protein product [Ectocarpus sp. CCAP 1310/34]|nr:unnamed protein product [Ectocarpus sp. CCAP 1310/34]
MAEEPRRGPPVVEIVLPTYITKPSEDEKFYPSEVKAVAEKAVEAELQDKEYDGEEAKEWSLNIADTIREGVKTLNVPRYKIVVQVTIGQMKDQGVRVASRCLWDTATDNYASVQFKNQSLWCSAMVFGVFTE